MALQMKPKKVHVTLTLHLLGRLENRSNKPGKFV